MKKTNTDETYLTVKRLTKCRECGRDFTGAARVFPGVRGTRLYMHSGCCADTGAGKALAEFNTNGGSVNSFSVAVTCNRIIPAERQAWAYFMRSCGFKVILDGNALIACAEVPAQSISKILRNARGGIVINGNNFTNVEKALEYVKSVTHGNSHKRG